MAIELHPFTRTYWLRELSLTGTTTVNGRHVNGQVGYRALIVLSGGADRVNTKYGYVFYSLPPSECPFQLAVLIRPIQMELHSGDLIRLGNAQPLVFEEGSLFSTRKISAEMRSISTNKSYDLPNGILPVLGVIPFLFD